MKTNAIKDLIKRKKRIHNLFLSFRNYWRIIYNTKTRSRFFWNLKKGDNRLSLDYPLNSTSIVFDVGAYKGNFTEKINSKFKCNIYAFEPIEEYSDYLNKKFLNYKNVVIYNFGLFDDNKEMMLSDIGGSSSIYNRAEGNLINKVKMRSFQNFIQENSIKKIDLLYMNIEGSEYKLLNHIIETGFIENINHLQVQFHNFVSNSKTLRNLLRKELKKTHECVFNFPFIWERWDKKV